MFEVLSIELIKVSILILYITLLSISDIRHRSISLYMIILGIFIMGLFYCFAPYSCLSLISGISVGIIIMLISILSKKSIGIGDGLVFLVIGISIGISTIYVLLYALMCASILFFIVNLFTKNKGNKQIPFIPFILIGLIINFIYDKITF